MFAVTLVPAFACSGVQVFSFNAEAAAGPVVTVARRVRAHSCAGEFESQMLFLQPDATLENLVGAGCPYVCRKQF